MAYRYKPPSPIVVPLRGPDGFAIREEAAAYVAANLNTTGAERGTPKQQGYGALAEIVVRRELGVEAKPHDHPAGHDLALTSGVKLDIKCRGGKRAFQTEYRGADGIPREAKHNLFARQLHDPGLDTEAYVLTHLQTTGDGVLPGSRLARNWNLFVCGWVSKERALRNGVYLPRGSLSERAESWFVYEGQEVEFYHKNLNGLDGVRDLLSIEPSDIVADAQKESDLNITSVDGMRLAFDLIGRGYLDSALLPQIRGGFEIADGPIRPILHPNQYHHFLRWLVRHGVIDGAQLEALAREFPEEPFAGI